MVNGIVLGVFSVDDDHAHKHSRTPQLYRYERDQPTLTNYTTLHFDKPRRN